MSDDACRGSDRMLITAKDLTISTGLTGGLGPWTFAAPVGPVATLGAAGSGKTMLLCALAGRMAGTRGQLRVAGIDAIADQRALRRATAVARIGNYVDLEDGLTVGDAITERALLEDERRSPAAAHYAHAAALIDLRVDHRDRIGQLDPLVRAKLTLALACIRPAELIVLDDAERDLNVVEQALLWGCMAAISADGTPVVAATAEATTVPPGVAVIDLVPQDAAVPDEAGPEEEADPEEVVED